MTRFTSNQHEPRSVTRRIPGIAEPDVRTRFLSFTYRSVLTMLAALNMLTNTLGTGMFAGSLGTRMFTGRLGSHSVTGSLDRRG